MELGFSTFSRRNCRLVIVLALSFVALCHPCTAQSQDLEAVETFWTSASKTAALGSAYPKVEVDGDDAQATLAVTLVNRTRQDITAIKATISLPAGVTQSNSTSKKPASIHPGVIRFGDTFTLLFPLKIAESFDNKSYRCPVVVSYNSVTSEENSTATVDAMLRTTGRTKLDVEPVGNLQPGKKTAVKIKVTNRGTAAAKAVELSFPSPSAALTLAGQRSFDIPAIDPAQTIELNVSVYANPASAGIVQTLPAQLTYTNACGQQTIRAVPLAIGVFASSQQTLIDLRPAENYLTAQPGMISQQSIFLVNQSDQDLSKVLVATTVGLDSLRIMGQQKWLVESLPAGEKHEIKIMLYAAKDLKGRATSLNFMAESEVNGEPLSENFNLGVFVDSNIDISLRDAAVSYIGGVPNLTGSLLNEGVGTAKFSSIEILPGDGWKPQQPGPQYLGDVVENSPQPFSFPLDAAALPPEGETKVRFQLNYKNALRESVSRELSAKVMHKVEASTSEDDSLAKKAELPTGTIAWFVGGILLGLGLATVFALRRTSQLTRILEEQKLEGRMSLDESLDDAIASQSASVSEVKALDRHFSAGIRVTLGPKDPHHVDHFDGRRRLQFDDRAQGNDRRVFGIHRRSVFQIGTQHFVRHWCQ